MSDTFENEILDNQIKNILRLFEYKHLPQNLQETSKLFHDLAHTMVIKTASSYQLIKSLDKLLEAKDAGVRAELNTLKVFDIWKIRCAYLEKPQHAHFPQYRLLVTKDETGKPNRWSGVLTVTDTVTPDGFLLAKPYGAYWSKNFHESINIKIINGTPVDGASPLPIPLYAMVPSVEKPEVNELVQIGIVEDVYLNQDTGAVNAEGTFLPDQTLILDDFDPLDDESYCCFSIDMG